MGKAAFNPSPPYKNYVLVLLLAICAFNYIDRLALGVVLEQVKADLSLSDTQLGLLTGIAFALFYSVLGIPIARWADRGNRTRIIALTALIWSIAVALCGFAATFVQLMLIRVAVAIGEAGCIPPAYSLIADYFRREERPRAAAIYGLGPPLASIIGYFLAGWLSELYGWRTVFMILGAPGLILAAIAWFTLIEPRHRRAAAPRVARPADDRLAELDGSVLAVLRALWNNRTFRSILLSFSVMYFFMCGILQWTPTFFARSHGLQTWQIGTGLSLALGGSGLLASLLGGELALRFAPADERWQLRGCALAVAFAGFVSAAVYLCPNPHMAFGFVGLYSFALGLVNGPLFATIQSIVPSSMRAMSFALLFLFANLIGMGFGPLSAGMLSDALRPVMGEESLRYALLLLAPGYLWAAWYLWVGSRTVQDDIAVVGTIERSNPVGRDEAAPTLVA